MAAPAARVSWRGDVGGGEREHGQDRGDAIQHQHGAAYRPAHRQHAVMNVLAIRLRDLPQRGANRAAFRGPRDAPPNAASSIASGAWPLTTRIATHAPPASAMMPAASPSTPSIKLNALVMP